MSGTSSDRADPREVVRHSFSWRRCLKPDPALADGDARQLAEVEASLLALPAMQKAALPKDDFEVAFRGISGTPEAPPEALEVRHLGLLSLDVIEFIERHIKKINRFLPSRRAALAPGLPMVPAEVWCPQEAPYPHLGTSDLALEQIRAAAAHDMGWKGRGVVVVIADQGINATVLRQRYPAVDFAGGWRVRKPQPGGSPGSDKWEEPGNWPDGHGTKMAELVLSVAPEATILDLPLLPDHIEHFRRYIDWATWIYWSMIWTIPWAKQQPVATFKGPWVFCNAWSVYDLRRDYAENLPWNYGKNPNSPLNFGVAALPRLELADIVFAAGNGGQFCPDPRCAPMQIGPGRSIYGVAALPQVLTVGAVRGDQIWLGYSAQGPSPPLFQSEKPDLVAPSQFTAPADAARGYSGTSAACALAAGGIAAVRSALPVPGGPSPAKVLRRARTTARPLLGVPPAPMQVGTGMLDLGAILGDPSAIWTGEHEAEPPDPAEEPIA